MYKSLFITLCAVLLLVSAQSFAKGSSSQKIEPCWVKTVPKSFNPQQRFVVVVDEGYSLKDIEENRYINLQNYLEKEVSTSGEIRTKVTQERNDSYLDFMTSVKGNKYQQKQIDEYWTKSESGRYTHYYLYSICTSAGIDAGYDIQVKSTYGGRGLWRSMLVPGWGQFYKGSNLKGGLILGGTVAFVGAIIATESLRYNYQQKMGQTYDVNSITYYYDMSNAMATSRNICIGGAVALYVYNLIDAIVAPGAKRIKVKKIKVSPYASIDNSGVALTYNF